MGATFAVGVGLVATAVAVVRRVFFGVLDPDELGWTIFAPTVWAFGIGTTFSTLLAVVSRGVSFERLSLHRGAASGCGAGLALFGLVSAGGAWREWASLGEAAAVAGVLAGLGAASATATLLVARRATLELPPAADRSVPADAGASSGPSRPGPSS